MDGKIHLYFPSLIWYVIYIIIFLCWPWTNFIKIHVLKEIGKSDALWCMAKHFGYYIHVKNHYILYIIFSGSDSVFYCHINVFMNNVFHSFSHFGCTQPFFPRMVFTGFYCSKAGYRPKPHNLLSTVHMLYSEKFELKNETHKKSI